MTEEKEQKLVEVDPTNLPEYMRFAMELTSTNHTNIPKVRTFYNQGGQAVFGVLILESEDSFLVGAPARLVKPSEKSEIVEVEPLYNTPVIRMMKSCTGAVVIPYPKTMAIYMEYLIDGEGGELLSEYMTEARVKKAIDILNTINANAGKKGEPSYVEKEGDIGYTHPSNTTRH